MSTLTTFPPIESPLDLSPEEFVAAARERGIGLVRRTTWNREAKCGCVLGVAAILHDPAFAVREGYVTYPDAADVLGLQSDERNAIMDGFDISAVSYAGHELAKRYEHGHRAFAKQYDFGRAVARAAGLD